MAIPAVIRLQKAVAIVQGAVATIHRGARDTVDTLARHST